MYISLENIRIFSWFSFSIKQKHPLYVKLRVNVFVFYILHSFLSDCVSKSACLSSNKFYYYKTHEQRY